MTAEPTTRTDDSPDTPEGCEFLMVDPATVEIAPNTRTDVVLGAHFVADIRARGVRSPIIVRRRASDGVLVLREGQRRVLASLKVGHPEIRALVEPEPAPAIGENYEDIPTLEVERIVDQLGENLHREPISDADEIRAHQQLLDLGLNRAQIARKTHTKAERVRQTTAVAASELATKAAARYDLDLIQLQAIAEFDDDPEAVKALIITAQQDPAQFPHLAQRLRDEREERTVHDQKVTELTEADVRVINRDDHDDATTLDRLRPSEDSAEGTALTEEEHRACPGHAAEVTTRRHFRDGPQARVTWVCVSPWEHGHYWRYNPTTGGADGSSGRQPGPMSEEEKAERRQVIANNKAWDSAEGVRREWITTLLGKKSAPKDTARYVATGIGQGDHDLRRAMEQGNAVACELLGLGQPSAGGYYTGVQNPIAAAAETASTARATVLLLGTVLGAFEAGTGRHSWRNPGPSTKRYFTRLQDWGYPLSDVERLVIDPGSDRAAADPDGADGDTDEVITGGSVDPDTDDPSDTQASEA
ncbi:MAG: ParB N-terminal domain-containing protein [Pseudonocardia sp.]|nr:ParB N-terminal domain-containing protein [Pseudonocardia sp.]